MPPAALDTRRIGLSAAKGALAGASEVAALALGFVLFEAFLHSGPDDQLLENLTVGVLIFIPLMMGAVVGVGLAVAVLTRLPMWVLVVVGANAVGLAASD